MRTMTVILALILVAMFGSACLAQAPANGKPAGARLAGLKALDLTKDQAQQIRGIVQNYRAEVAAVTKGPGTPQEKRVQIRPIRAKATEAIAAVLTPDQLAKAKENRLIQRMLSRTAIRQAGLMALVRRLDLADNQKTQVNAIFAESQAKAKAIGTDSSLSTEQKKTARTELRKATRSQVMAVLTPEQQEKLKQMTQNRRRRVQANS